MYVCIKYLNALENFSEYCYPVSQCLGKIVRILLSCISMPWKNCLNVAILYLNALEKCLNIAILYLNALEKLSEYCYPVSQCLGKIVWILLSCISMPWENVWILLSCISMPWKNVWILLSCISMPWKNCLNIAILYRILPRISCSLLSIYDEMISFHVNWHKYKDLNM